MTPKIPPGHPLLLIIVDGFALNPDARGNAVAAADAPTFRGLLERWPHTTLTSFGPRVGLPEGQMGNSEVGHLNIGGGRVVQQELTKINAVVSSGKIGERPALKEAYGPLAASPSAALHFIGLVSEGGVHSSLEHLLGLLRSALESGVRRCYVHAITDGRDRPPTASLNEVAQLVDLVGELSAKYPDADLRIASICGRYYAMDRDKRWERTERAYRLLTEGIGEQFHSPLAAIAARHEAGETDEFIQPLFLAPDSSRKRPSTIEDGDSVLFFNFRADRMRQIVRSFFDATFDGFERPRRPKLEHLLTLTEYEEDFPVRVLFPPEPVRNHLGAVLAQHGIPQARIAETEKYAHVTYFFNGGDETPLEGEERVLVQSPRDVPTYDLKPEMSAAGVTEQILARLVPGGPRVIIINFANCDMVGHTGSMPAAVKAVETVDRCLAKILPRVTELGGAALVTADHGNADQMIDYTTNEPHTFHTMYPVPFVVFGPGLDAVKLREGGALCDIAPTVCDLLGLPLPAEMTGRSLIL